MMGVHDWIPRFHAGDLFTYFTSLEDGSGWGNVPYAKMQLAQNAKQAFGEIAKDFQDGGEILNLAIKFLGAAAQSERSKELAAIEQYRQKIKIELKDWENAQALQEFFDYLDRINLDDDFKDYQDFNLKLTKAINLIHQQQTEYIGRLEQIIHANETKDFTTDELFGSTSFFRDYGDIIGILNDIIGLAQRESKDMEDNVAKTLRVIMGDYIKNNAEQLLDFGSGENIIGVLAGMALDIQNLAQQEVYKQNIAEGTFNKITPEIVKQVANEYMKFSSNKLTAFQKALQIQDKELFFILQSVEKALGLKTLTEAEIKQRQHITQERIAASENKQRNRIAKILTNNRATRAQQELYNRIFKINFNARTEQSHGVLAEAISAVVKKGITTTRGTAVDRVVLGSIGFDPTVSLDRESLLEWEENFLNKLNDMAPKEKEDRFEDGSNYYKELNKDLQSIVDKLKDAVDANPNIDQLFIFHESLKMYQTLEYSQKTDFKGFHGRELNIFSAFDLLYSAAGAEELKFTSMDSIKLIALNLSSLALGHNYKPDLEKYLSVFAGLLMFDDIRNMALNIGQNLMNESVQQVHVYLLNNIYVPSSVVLQNLFEQFSEVITKVDASQAAKVTITTTEIDKAIAAYDPEEYSLELWPEYGEAARQGTKVHIIFLTSFLQFLNDLMNI